MFSRILLLKSKIRIGAFPGKNTWGGGGGVGTVNNLGNYHQNFMICYVKDGEIRMMNWYLVLLISFLGSEIKSTSRKRNVVKWHDFSKSIDPKIINYTYY
jgi:hypothetical protein